MKLEINSKVDGFEITFHGESVLSPSTYDISPKGLEESVKAIIEQNIHLATSQRVITEYVIPYSVFEIFTQLALNVVPDDEFSKALLTLKNHHDCEEVDSTVFLKDFEFGDSTKNYSIDLSRMFKVVENGIRIVPNEHSARIEVLQVNWLGCHERTYSWILAKEVSLDCNFKVEIRKLLNSKHFGYCKTCNEYTLRGHMFGRDLCDGCATHHCGVMF